MSGAHEVRVGRAYDECRRGDGRRVQVDRLWPRGLSKATLDFDEWSTVISPSTALRTWHDHDPSRFGELACRNQMDLEDAERAGALGRLRKLTKRQALTLLTATRHAQLSHAAILADALRDRGRRER